MMSWQVRCARLASVVGGFAAQDSADNVAGVDARTAQEAAMGAAPTRSGAQGAGALVPAWKAA